MTNTATEAKMATLVTGVQVGDINSTHFDGFRWREGILGYLNGMWSGRTSANHRSKIYFSALTAEDQVTSVRLQFDFETKTYYVAGDEINPGQVPPNCGPEATIIVENQRAEVEQGLIRFVKDDRIRLFYMFLRPSGIFCLWKSGERSELYLSAAGVGSR